MRKATLRFFVQRLTSSSRATEWEWITRAPIDTGSPITVFDRGAADALGIRIGQTGAQTGFIALLGAERMIQFDYVDLTLVGHPEVTWTARVAFVRDAGFQMAFQGILGAAGFLDRWAVTFNRYYDYFEIVPPDDCMSQDSG